MRNLLEALDPAGDDILCLMNHEGDAVWRLWVKPHLNARTKKPGTIISYLTSYEKFLTLVTHERFNKKAPAIHPSYMKDFSNTLKDLKGWRPVVDSQSYDVKNQRMVDESEGLLTLEELNKMKSSSTYNQAERLLIQAGRGKDLDMKEFILVRDFLLTRFSLDTGTRHGPLNNATLKEYATGKVEDGSKVMLVARHKRAQNGPAICPMLPQLYKFMEIYVRRIRPDYAKLNEDALFVTNKGCGFTEGTIGCRLSSFVEKCGIRLGSRMAFVDMRKIITTEMLNQCNPEEKAIVRRVLAHSEKTSRDWYTRPDLTRTGIQAVNIIQHLLNSDERAKFYAKTSSAATSKEDIEKSSKPPSPDPSAATQSQLSAGKTTSASSSGIVPPTLRERTLSDLQKQMIKKTFRNELKGSESVTMKEALLKMRGVPILSAMSQSKDRVKQVVNFLNHLIRKERQSTPPDSEANSKDKVSSWLDDFDDPSTRSG